MTAAQRGLGIDAILGDKRETILRLAAEHGATNVLVFGSVARGEATSMRSRPARTHVFDAHAMRDAVAL
jgi:hypothetical protein